MEEKKLIEELSEAIQKSGAKVTFGIQPNHIKRIESEVERWNKMIEEGDGLEPGWILYTSHFWESMGKEFSWSPLALALDYFRTIGR